MFDSYTCLEICTEITTRLYQDIVETRKYNIKGYLIQFEYIYDVAGVLVHE